MGKHSESDPFRNFVNKTGHTVMLWRSANGSHKHRVLDKRANDLHPEGFPRCRVGANYPHRRNYEGMYPFLRTGQNLWYESLTELRSLVSLEHTQRIAGISTQPFCLAFPNGTRHYPDFYAVHDDRTRVLYDVKLLEHQEAAQAQFSRTREVCEAMGWGYEVLHEIDSINWKNLEVLAYHRTEAMHPDPLHLNRLLEHLQSPRSLAEAALHLDEDHPAWQLPGIYHLMFRQAVAYEHDRPLSMDTRVWVGAGDATCIENR